MRPILSLLLCLAIPADAFGQQAPAPHPSTRVPYIGVRDTISGAKLPRLTEARTPQTRNVNRQLESISTSLRCLERIDPFGHKTEHWSDSRTTYAAGDVLSVYVRFGGFCGGAHPVNGENLSTTFDLRTGKPVAFRDLFADYARDAPAIVRAMFPAQTAAADRLPPAAAEYDTDDEEYCLQLYATDELARQSFAYTFTYEGVVVEPSLGHALRACQEPSPVPYERLRPFAAPGSILDRVARARSSTGAR